MDYITQRGQGILDGLIDNQEALGISLGDLPELAKFPKMSSLPFPHFMGEEDYDALMSGNK